MIDWIDEHLGWVIGGVCALVVGGVLLAVFLGGGDDHPGEHCVDQETRLQPMLIGKTTTLMPETYCAKWAKDVTP